MDCNKEDAIKAMQLAERKMQVNDFIGARKLAQEAQQLFPGLENLSQLLAVCEVHCCAENKLGGCEMDWYGILQVQRFSHEATVKKQFRKLELLLHPEKNKFAGAEAAFKLIGEANAVLEDRGRHFRYDMKCRALLRTGKITSAHQSDENLFVLKHCDAAGNAQNILPSQNASTEEHQKGEADTFNTCCPFCRTVYDCAKHSVNRLLLCQRCQRLFIASALDIQGLHPETLVKKYSNCDGDGNPPVKRIQSKNAASNLPAACPVPKPRPIKELINEYGSADEEFVLRKLIKDLKGNECDRIKVKGSTPAENCARARELMAQALFYLYLADETEEHEHERLKKQVGDLTAHRSYLEQENSRLHREVERLDAELKKRDRKVEQFKDKAKGLEEENTKLRSDLHDEQNKSRDLNDRVIELQARVMKQDEEIARMKAVHHAVTNDMKDRVIIS